MSNIIFGNTLSDDGHPAQLARRSIAMICASVYLLVCTRNLLMHLAEKILLMQILAVGGAYPPPIRTASHCRISCQVPHGLHVGADLNCALFVVRDLLIFAISRFDGQEKYASRKLRVKNVSSVSVMEI